MRRARIGRATAGRTPPVAPVDEPERAYQATAVFRDRTDAGVQLARRLQAYAGRPDASQNR